MTKGRPFRLRCEKCYQVRFLKTSIVKNGVRWWKCANCGDLIEGYDTSWIRRDKIQPRELYLDIETSPDLLLNYGLKVPSRYLNSENIVNDWYIMAFTAKWINDDNKPPLTYCVTRAEALSWWDGNKWADERLLTPLKKVLDEADIVWGHNVKGFDLKMVNTRLMAYGSTAYVKPKVLDTLTIARSTFRFDSNKLDFILKYLGHKGKDDMNQDDWRECLRGSKKALDKMKKYNINDVVRGVKVVKQFRGWIEKPRATRTIRDSV